MDPINQPQQPTDQNNLQSNVNIHPKRNWYKYGFWGLIVISFIFIVGFIIFAYLSMNSAFPSGSDVSTPIFNPTGITQPTKIININSTSYCRQDSDCVNMCLGCFPKGSEPQNDCLAIPQGSCICANNLCQKFFKNKVIDIITPSSSPTTNWPFFEDNSLKFNYPKEMILDGYELYTEDKGIRIFVTKPDGTMMNECMNLDSTEKVNNFLVKKFSRVVNGTPACGTGDSTEREIWIVPSEQNYAPGITYYYKSTDPQAVTIFNQILTTFQFK